MEQRAILFDNLHYFDGQTFRKGEMLVDGGTIRAVGERLDGPAARNDLGGAYVAPAFNDCHCHVSMLAETFSFVDVSAERCPTVASVLQALKERAESANHLRWVVAHGYLASAVRENRYPTLEELDSAVPKKPCYIWHASRHGIVANSAALRIAGIGENTEDPPGGKIGRDEKGKPNGLLFENAIGLVRKMQPKLSKEQLADNLLPAAERLNRMGITSVTDAASFRLGLTEELWAYRTAAERGMTLRVRLTPVYELFGTNGGIPTRAQWDPIAGHPTVCIGAVKLFADGAIGTRTAAISGEYRSGGSGMLVKSPEQLDEAVWDIHCAGRQVMIHAIGDVAVEVGLAAIEKALVRQPRPDHRHRIEHAMLVTPEAIRRSAELGVCACMQPEFLLRFAEEYIAALGDRAMCIEPLRSLLDAGVRVGFGSDFTIVEGNPADGLLAAVHRRSAGGTQLDVSQSLQPEEALRCYTEGSAYLGFKEHAKGRIAPGVVADFVVYEQNPLDLLREGERPLPASTFFAGRQIELSS